MAARKREVIPSVSATAKQTGLSTHPIAGEPVRRISVSRMHARRATEAPAHVIVAGVSHPQSGVTTPDPFGRWWSRPER